MGKIHIDADANPIAAEMARLNRLQKLVPSNEDISRYGLEVEEMAAVCSLFENFEGDISPVIQLVVTVLRKRKAEKPDKPLLFRDLAEFVVLMTEDEHRAFTKPFLRELRQLGIIKKNRDKLVSIKI